VTQSSPTGDDRRDDTLEAGFAVRRAVLGDDHVERAIARTDDLTRDFQELITRYAWGEVWARPGLDRRTRSCLTLALLTALHCHEELALHVRAAVTNGVTREEIAEVLLHTSVYAGVPAANSAFAVAREALAQIDAEGRATEDPDPEEQQRREADRG
jgi:4-carboxymuconolactone decarboxylase